MLKRVFDITACLFSIPLIIPVLAIAAIVIKFDSRGPVLYRGWRTGLGGKPFLMYKFRTMVINAEKTGGPSTAFNDPRLTSIGRFLRKYKIDELPQLINILRGEMSFVGPRPQVKRYTKLYTDAEQVILSVRPGLTDYASIRFINLDQILGDDAVDEKYFNEIEPEKNKLRVKYAMNNSVIIDIKIVAITFVQMLNLRCKWNIED